MKTKFYFENEDADQAHSEAFFQEQMKSEGIIEMTVLEAVSVPHSKSDYVYCIHSDSCLEKSECGKKCSYYKAANGKNGKYEFRGQYCDYGEEVTLKVEDKNP